MLRLVNQFAWKKQFHSLWSLSKRAQTQISHEILRKYKPKTSIAFYLIAVLIYSVFWGCHCIKSRHILCKCFSFPLKQSIVVFPNVIETFTRKFVTWRWRKCDKHELIDTDVHFCLVSKTLRNWKSAFGLPHRHSRHNGFAVSDFMSFTNIRFSLTTFLLLLLSRGKKVVQWFFHLRHRSFCCFLARITFKLLPKGKRRD